MAILEDISLDNILLNENAYFYKKKRSIEKKDINKIFSEALLDKKAYRKFKTIIRNPFFDGSKAIAKYSLDIFEYKSKPSFFKKSESNKTETKYGFLLILEFEDYIALIRKNVSGITHIHSIAESVDYKTLSYFLITQKSKFEKIVSSNMNTADNAIQTKTFEAIDLKGILSRFGASKQILNSLRLDNNGEKHTVVLNTSRVNSFKLKNDFNAVVFWMIEMLKLIRSAESLLPKSSFLDGFASSLKFNDVIKDLEPTYILLRFGNLKTDIENGTIERCYYKDNNEDEITVDLLNFINENEKLYELNKVNDVLYENNSLKVKINKLSISISDENFKNLILDYSSGVSLNLNQYLMYGNNYIINFNKIDYVYSHGKIFRDSKLLGDLDNFFDTFIPFKEITNVTSEKGKIFNETMTSFNADSLFGFVENLLMKDSEYLICDDMGAEWGDFIAMNNENVTFLHAKYHDGGLSATNLEEVFGQAQKNFGYLELTDDMIEFRKEKWMKNYRLNGVQTKISRIRKCPVVLKKNQIEIIKDFANAKSSNVNFKRRVFIVLNFISKSELEKSIKELVDGKKFPRKGVTLQILWFVNSLLCSAHELSTEIRIYCKP